MRRNAPGCQDLGAVAKDTSIPVLLSPNFRHLPAEQRFLSKYRIPCQDSGEFRFQILPLPQPSPQAFSPSVTSQLTVESRELLGTRLRFPESPSISNPGSREYHSRPARLGDPVQTLYSDSKSHSIKSYH